MNKKELRKFIKQWLSDYVKCTSVSGDFKLMKTTELEDKAYILLNETLKNL